MYTAYCKSNVIPNSIQQNQSAKLSRNETFLIFLPNIHLDNRVIQCHPKARLLKLSSFVDFAISDLQTNQISQTKLVIVLNNLTSKSDLGYASLYSRPHLITHLERTAFLNTKTTTLNCSDPRNIGSTMPNVTLISETEQRGNITKKQSSICETVNIISRLFEQEKKLVRDQKTSLQSIFAYLIRFVTGNF